MAEKEISKKELEIRRRLRDNFEYYAPRALKIRPKEGELVDFTLNKAQKYVHSIAERQKELTGRVRVIVLKGRQQGISTYIEGRFYWKVTHRRGVRAFILTHEDAATQNLFEMAQRYHDNCPERIRPQTGNNSAKELNFEKLDSGYKIGTAGTKAVGRSSTPQYFHGCLSPDTFYQDGVTGKLKRMGDAVVGDWVRTHTGKQAQISFISRKQAECYKIELRAGGVPVVATGEHKFWTKDGMKRLDDIQVGDCIGYPVDILGEPKITRLSFSIEKTKRQQGGGREFTAPESIDLDYPLGLVVGLYLADGCVSANRVDFAMDIDDVERNRKWLERIEGYASSIGYCSSKDSRTRHLVAYGRAFTAFIERLCGAKDEKRFPHEWRIMPVEFVRGIVHGYLSGDGAFPKQKHKVGNRVIKVTSIRSALSVSVRDACASLGYGWGRIVYRPAGIRSGRNEQEAYTFVLSGAGVNRMCSELGRYEVPYKRKGAGDKSIEISNDYAWLPVKSKEPVGIQPVMDFEVDHEDHSYLLSHIASSNSEVAFWPHADTHAMGVIQGVPDVDETEIWLESTANGIGNYFHQQWQLADMGETDFIAVFLPWFWQDEYKRPLPEDWRLTADEADLMEQFGKDGLTEEHLCWRRNKILQFQSGGDDGDWKFKQEYPMCIAAGTLVGTARGIIPIEDVVVGDVVSHGVVTNAWKTGEKETVVITTKRGFSVRCTPEHRILCGSGEWVEAAKSVGESIQLGRPLLSTEYKKVQWHTVPGVRASVIIDEKWGKFLGYFVGDGSYHNTTLSIVCDKQDDDTVSDVVSVMTELVGAPTCREVGSKKGGIEVRIGNKYMRTVLDNLGVLRGENGRLKRLVCVPECIKSSPYSVVREFLVALYESDGFAGYDSPRISLYSKHISFLKDVQLLLLSFGLPATLNERPTVNGSGYKYIARTLDMYGGTAIKFGEEIGFVSKRKSGRIAGWGEAKSNGRRREHLSMEDEVISVVPAGKVSVYDLSVLSESAESEHRFDAGGIVVHNCAAEAFQTSGSDSLIDPKHVLAARKRELSYSAAHLVGVDPARFGKDRTAIIHRQGRKAHTIKTMTKKSTMEVAGMCARILRDPITGERTDVDMMFIDVGGLGAGVYDRLVELGFEDEGRIIALNSSDSPLDDKRYKNKRAEMWVLMRDWFELPGGVDIPDEDALQEDLCGPMYSYDSNSRYVIEKKENMMKRGLRSPDIADALALTFAEPVAPPSRQAKQARRELVFTPADYSVGY